MPRLARLDLAGTPAASAKGGDGVTVHGRLRAGSNAKLKLGREDSGTEIEFEVDQNRNAVPVEGHAAPRRLCRSRRRRSGRRAPSGSFEYRKNSSGAGDVHRDRDALGRALQRDGDDLDQKSDRGRRRRGRRRGVRKKKGRSGRLLPGRLVP